MCSTQTSHGGVIGAPDLLLVPFVMTISRTFFLQGGTAEVWWITGETLKKKERKERKKKKKNEAKKS